MAWDFAPLKFVATLASTLSGIPGGFFAPTLSIGAGYRLLLNDWLAAHFDVRDHVFEIDLLGSNKTTHNLETGLGVTVFF